MEPQLYFRAHYSYFWQWEEGGDVIAIPGGDTIGYRAFVADVLEKIHPQGFPPFGSLLLAIAATNPNAHSAIDAIYSIVSGTLDKEKGHAVTFQASAEQTSNITYSMPNTAAGSVVKDESLLSTAIAFLKLLTDIPQEYKTGKKRILLLQALFWNCHNISSAKNAAQAYQFFLNKDRAYQADGRYPSPDGIFQRDFKVIYHLAVRFPYVSDIIDRIGELPDLPHAPELGELETPPTTTELPLIEQLVADPKTFHTGSLIKHIWGGLNIPVHSAVPSRQPLGGVSDISNKGDLDKLLISEFANDDLVFLSRLANNEALYLQRETPPAKNTLQRIILIDTTLKNWGTPRVLAFATMLAIATHPKTNIACSVFLLGRGYTPISINSKRDIIDALQQLDGSLHCANGLTAFLEEHATNTDTEIILLSEASTINNPTMFRALNEATNIAYRIATDAAGNIDVYKRQKNSIKHLQHMQLPLTDLWKNPPRTIVTVLPEAATVPGFMTVPLLFRVGNKHKYIIRTTDGCTFVVTGDSVLLRWNGKTAKGWELMLDNLSTKPCIYAVGYSSAKEHIFLCLQLDTKQLSLTNLVSGQSASTTFDGWKHSWPAFVFHDDKFYHKNESGVWTIDINCNIAAGQTMPANLLEQHRQQAVQSSELNATSSVLKNIHTIFINEVNNLVFNVHELLMLTDGTAIMEKSDFQKREYPANKNANGDFEFADGSIIKIHKAGAIILRSADTSLPDIYLTSVINKAIGMYAGGEFAGNNYYYRSGKEILPKAFETKYIEPFVLHIKQHRQHHSIPNRMQ